MDSPVRQVRNASCEAAVASDGLRERLTDWVRQFGPALRRFFARRVHPADADELVQELFVGLARHPRLDRIERPESYLFHAAANVLRDRIRKNVTHLAHAHESFSGDLHGGEDASPEHVLICREELERLIDRLGELKERTRTVFVLYHFEGLPHAEIAARLGIAISTVEKQMAKATEHLLSSLRSSS